MEDKAIEMKPIMGKKKAQPKKTVEQVTEPTADQFKQLVDQLYTRNQQLVEALNEKNTAMMFKRLDYLFKVLEYSHMFDDEFVAKCIEELQKTLDVTQIEEEQHTEDGEQD